jgi:predicted outer membrane repeat protein
MRQLHKKMRVYHLEIRQNSALDGGGICCKSRHGSIVLKGGSIKNNRAASRGGAIYFQGTVFTMQDGEIINNTAGKDGVVYMAVAQTVLLYRVE